MPAHGRSGNFGRAAPARRYRLADGRPTCQSRGRCHLVTPDQPRRSPTPRSRRPASRPGRSARRVPRRGTVPPRAPPGPASRWPRGRRPLGRPRRPGCRSRWCCGLAQLSEDTGILPDAIRAGLAGWLLGHGVPLEHGPGPLGLAPLAVTALAAWRLTRAGVHVSPGHRRPWRSIARGRHSPPRSAVGIGYALLGGVAAVLVGAGRADACPRSGPG